MKTIYERSRGKQPERQRQLCDDMSTGNGAWSVYTVEEAKHIFELELMTMEAMLREKEFKDYQDWRMQEDPKAIDV